MESFQSRFTFPVACSAGPKTGEGRRAEGGYKNPPRETMEWCRGRVEDTSEACLEAEVGDHIHSSWLGKSSCFNCCLAVIINNTSSTLVWVWFG